MSIFPSRIRRPSPQTTASRSTRIGHATSAAKTYGSQARSAPRPYSRFLGATRNFEPWALNISFSSPTPSSTASSCTGDNIAATMLGKKKNLQHVCAAGQHASPCLFRYTLATQYLLHLVSCNQHTNGSDSPQRCRIKQRSDHLSFSTTRQYHTITCTSAGHRLSQTTDPPDPSNAAIVSNTYCIRRCTHPAMTDYLSVVACERPISSGVLRLRRQKKTKNKKK